MNPDHFYQHITKLATLSPYDRYARLGKFHTDLVIQYLDVIRSVNKIDVQQLGANNQSICQTIAEIAEWERFTIFAAGELISGVPWPQMMNLSGYIDGDTQSRTFADKDDFRAYVREKFTGCPWAEIRDLALHTATAIHTLFTHPTLLSPDTLEKTKKQAWPLPNGLKISLPVGWYLWMTAVEREALAYATELHRLK
ncbi:MAG: hypothetical protein KDJ52_21395 [Anaerolineae bacterium]|nr:hypothetical protein [Anaerolineae bacterium]